MKELGLVDDRLRMEVEFLPPEFEVGEIDVTGYILRSDIFIDIIACEAVMTEIRTESACRMMFVEVWKEVTIVDGEHTEGPDTWDPGVKPFPEAEVNFASLVLPGAMAIPARGFGYGSD